MTKKGLIISVILLILLGAGAYYVMRGSGGPIDEPIDEELMVKVTSPKPNDAITSPVTVEGVARGNWYFEASFPVSILDANGRELSRTAVQAQGEWMTTEFVPFASTINFSTPTTQTGFVVFEKDNPSGLPENAAEYRVPVRFVSAENNTP